jgi:signal transduction histidine kinase
VLYRSPRLEDRDLAVAPPPELNHPRFRWIRSDDFHARAVDLRTIAVVDPEDWQEANLPSPKGPVIRLVAAHPTTELDVFLARLRTLLIGVGALGGLLVALVLAAVIQRSLRPLDRLATEISGLSDDNMSARVRMTSVPQEVTSVVEQLNQLLARLEEAFVREHTFSSDIAHELRTPLAGLRSTLEVALSRPRETDDYRATMDALLGIVRRVENMVETLLYLAGSTPARWKSSPGPSISVSSREACGSRSPAPRTRKTPTRRFTFPARSTSPPIRFCWKSRSATCSTMRFRT